MQTGMNFTTAGREKGISGKSMWKRGAPRKGAPCRGAQRDIKSAVDYFYCMYNIELHM